LADDTIRVPIAGAAESLNLAAAAAVILFEAARQRGGGGEGGDPLAAIVAGAAHDLRSPLTAVKGFTSTIVSRWSRLDDSQRLMMLGGIGQDAARMEVIVGQLVDAARLITGTLRFDAVRTDLLEVASAAREDLAKWTDWQVEVRGAQAFARADPAKVRGMLIAMAESAQWWGEKGPVQLEVTAEAEPSVTVSRAGPSLEPEVVAEFFHPRTPGSGAGSKVGLYVARALADAQGGRLEMAGEDGIHLTLTLPAWSGH
jgi:K+-sensing histidine kinase KdpD